MYNIILFLGVHLPHRVPFPTTGCAHPLREPGTDNTLWFMTKIGLTGIVNFSNNIFLKFNQFKYFWQ